MKLKQTIKLVFIMSFIATLLITIIGWKYMFKLKNGNWAINASRDDIKLFKTSAREIELKLYNENNLFKINDNIYRIGINSYFIKRILSKCIAIYIFMSLITNLVGCLFILSKLKPSYPRNTS